MSERFSLAADSTQIVAFLQCPEMWNFAYRRNLTHKYVSTERMDKGTIFHGLLERYYSAQIKGGNWVEAQQFAVQDLNKDIKRFRFNDDEYKFMKQRFNHYALFYMQHDVVPVKTECGFSIPIFDSENFFFVLEGRIDMIASTRDGSTKIIMDTKTQDRESYYSPKSIQFKNYALAAGINNGFVNYVRWHKEVQPNTFERRAFYFSNLELMRWKEKLISIFFQMAHAIMMKKYNRNLATCQNSGWGHECQYMEICPEWERNKQVRKGLTQINFMKKPEWKPWEMNGNA